MDNSKPQTIYLLFGYQNHKLKFNDILLDIYYTLKEVQKRQYKICFSKSTFSRESNITRNKE